MAQYKQCPQGHYYDPSMYSTCPYCSGVSRSVESGGISGSRTIPVNYPDNVPPAVPASSGGAGGIPTMEVVDRNKPESVSGQEPAGGIGGGATVPVDLFKKPREPLKPEDSTKFVVGWLVAVEGPYCGQSFELYNGYCSIGRLQGDILLKKDEHVSAERNISTVYDSENNCFFITAGQSKNVAYFNGKAILSGMSKEMNAYDEIKVGKTKFIFVPFCCDKFRWNAEE